MLLAHAFGSPVEIPLPLSVFFIGASVVLVFSFLALGVLWRTSRWEGDVAGESGSRPLPAPLPRFARGAALLGRVAVLLAFLGVFYAAIAGRNLVDANVAPRAVFVIFWVGLTVVSAFFGDIWRAVSPFDTVCAIGQWLRDRLHREGAPPRPYPAEWGYWPAAVLLFGFVWFELVFPDSGDPRNVGFAMEVYTLAMLAGAATWGREWLHRGDAFAVYFRLLAAMAPFYKAPDGQLRVRLPLAGLAELTPTPGLAAVVFVALGSTSFDGLSRTTFWAELTAGQYGNDRLLTGTLGLAWMIITVAVLYVGSMRLAGRILDKDPEELAAWFLPSLVPIVFAYALAHYFSLLIFESQTAVVLASDPLGRGWDLVGTAGWIINLTFISSYAIAWVQAGSIVFGHLAGVVVAHDRALRRLDGASAKRSQYPLLVAMVIYTVGGLALLFGR